MADGALRSPPLPTRPPLPSRPCAGISREVKGDHALAVTSLCWQVRIAAISQIGMLLHPLCASLASEAMPPADEALIHPLSAEAEARAAVESGAAQISEFVASVGALTRAPSCHKRANAVHICRSLIDGLPPQTSIDSLLPHLQPLTSDRVANVRLPLAALVKDKLLPPASPFAELPISLEMAEALRVDVDRDVLRAIHPDGYEPPPYKCKPIPPPVRPSAIAAEGATDDTPGGGAGPMAEAPAEVPAEVSDEGHEEGAGAVGDGSSGGEAADEVEGVMDGLMGLRMAEGEHADDDASHAVPAFE